MNILSITIFAALLSCFFLSYAEMAIPEKEEIIRDESMIVKRDPIYPWSLANLADEYKPNINQKEYDFKSAIQKIKDKTKKERDGDQKDFDSHLTEPFVK